MTELQFKIMALYILLVFTIFSFLYFTLDCIHSKRDKNNFLTTNKNNNGQVLKWVFEKFKGDMAIYATCPNCDYTYNVTSAPDLETGEYKIDRQYKYCPECGEYLFDENEEVDVAWDERNIEELYMKEGEENIGETKN